MINYVLQSKIIQMEIQEKQPIILILNEKLKTFPNGEIFQDSKTLIEKLSIRNSEKLISSSKHENVLKDSAFQESPFLKAVHIAFSEHFPLVIDPDSFWLTILSSIAQFVNNNPKECQKFFVSFEGKQTITIKRNDFQSKVDLNPWEETIPEFIEKIKNLVPKSINESAICDFSTSNKTSLIVSQIMFMDTLSSYLNYELSTECGIPSIILNGNETDWINIKKKLTSFIGIGMDPWLDNIGFLVDQIVQTCKGKKNIEFWNNIYKGHDGSGGITFNGWSSLLHFYDSKQKPFNFHEIFNRETFQLEFNLSFSDFACRTNRVPFIWMNGESKHEMFFSCGTNLITQNQETQAIKIEPFWSIVQKQ